MGEMSGFVSCLLMQSFCRSHLQDMNYSLELMRRLALNKNLSGFHSHSDANISFHLSNNTYSNSFADLLLGKGTTGHIKVNLLNHLSETLHLPFTFCLCRTLAGCIIYHCKCFSLESTTKVTKVEHNSWI